MKVTTDKSTMNKAIRELDQLDRYSLQIGLFGEDDSFIQMIAGVHEFGLTIRPKGKYLTIPTQEAGDRRARDIPGLFKPRGKNILAVAGPDGKLTVMFYLKKEVNIPERSFLRSTFDEKSNKWGELFEGWIDDIIHGKLSAEQVYNRLGAKIVDDIQMKIVEIQTPAKSAATLARNPRKNNPLIVTGKMKNSVTWKVMKS
ncbi:hypothetical protein NMB04_002846 [Listeria monocytogenes]|uniref:hypothetical protein n=1 Tax=Listeria monocytogenes TaxID=1639 RepID=UPI000E770954|nr:hypothetical protein [Listeria monocytogenes]EAC4967781.1 hypothetical protein [Listeria monocytogenes]EAD6705627.1 hypothetical protein [Listeria monocytogenes]EAE0273280.1 hypothetical protein [Listeria monocytogenes]EAE1334058.1 hypothetical protein [Listeria monocytogenes]EAE1346250.1 hypothetical protein [Listeria monocytogenes]